jgi:7,8-dihydro-6-hydroxymethylpterin-pyrophosphokinase
MKPVELTEGQWDLIFGALVYTQQNACVGEEESKPYFNCCAEIERQLENPGDDD